jgi:hypothetical protein
MLSTGLHFASESTNRHTGNIPIKVSNETLIAQASLFGL